jgi:hypothetical protein
MTQEEGIKAVIEKLRVLFCDEDSVTDKTMRAIAEVFIVSIQRGEAVGHESGEICGAQHILRQMFDTIKLLRPDLKTDDDIEAAIKSVTPDTTVVN